MNLVQTQYHLRDLPDAEIKAFADGKDPATVPEWLAASEMQRRQRMEMASNKAPQKSVKERLEETMGLKALQAQRQQQAGQQMGEQAMAMPTIPENVPQPEAQPEVQEAASGGLMSGIAKLPVEMFHQAAYAGGGIVAFESGGKTARKVPKEEMSQYGLISDQEDQSDAERQRLMYAEQEARIRMGKPFYGAAGTSLVNLPTDKAPVSEARSLKGASSIPDVPPPSSPAYDELMRRIGQQEQAIENPEDIIAKRQALLQQQGVRPAGEDQEGRLNKRDTAYAQEKKDRAFNNLIASMAAYGRPNITGRGQGSDYANTAVRGFEAGRAEDRQFQDAQDKLRDAIEAQRRAEKVGNVDMALKAIEDQKKAKVEMDKAKLSASGQAAQVDVANRNQGLQYLSDQLKIKSAEDIAKINRLSAERVAAMNRSPVPQVVAVAEWLMEKDPKLEREEALRIGAEIANTGRLEGVDAKRTADADKAFKDQNKQEIMLAALEKDPAKKKAMQDALDAKKEKIYREYKVRPGDGVSSEQGGGTSSAGWGQAEKVK
jgi:hypothetical protein